jgi:hypothetical protein
MFPVLLAAPPVPWAVPWPEPPAVARPAVPPRAPAPSSLPFLFSFSSPSLFFLSSSLSFLFQYLAYSSLFEHLEIVMTYKSYKPKCSYIIIVINTKTTYNMRYDLSAADPLPPPCYEKKTPPPPQIIAAAAQNLKPQDQKRAIFLRFRRIQLHHI